MEGTFRRYPIGIQSFERLRNDNCVYIDKTELIYRLVNTHTTYFLSRPRRFGKSLLVSTLEAYFSGKKDLFKGLMMEQLEKDWTVYPVLHIDFSISKYMNAGMLRSAINNRLVEWERMRHERRHFQSPPERHYQTCLRAERASGCVTCRRI